MRPGRILINVLEIVALLHPIRGNLHARAVSAPQHPTCVRACDDGDGDDLHVFQPDDKSPKFRLVCAAMSRASVSVVLGRMGEDGPYRCIGTPVRADSRAH
jgi:hypothetical protein